ncbi:hypothetical protein HG530_008159 [Fusarium avenaceum]|nr:hypothetical protein HG530_008159 [Fusarium avenaceum]
MHEVKYTDYKLSPASFQAWLRDTFGDPSIVVECKNGYFVFNLQDGVDLTEDHDLEIYRKLRGYKRWPQPWAFDGSSPFADQRVIFVYIYQKLFEPSKEEIVILEPKECTYGYSEEVATSPAGLQQHLLHNREDPHCCMIFITSEDSRAPLNSSYESFTYLSSFYQIPASFLDFVSSFGYTKLPKDYHMTGFNGLDTLDESGESILQIPRLGRSGCEHSTQYLLRSVEKDVGPTSKPVWKIRQMVVHHQYDFITGKSFWLNIKTNGLMQERIKEAIADDPSLGPTPADGLAKSFSATLLTHLIHLQWCDDSWRHCINDFEKEVRDVLEKATTARVDQQPVFSTIVKHVLTMRSTMNGNDAPDAPKSPVSSEGSTVLPVTSEKPVTATDTKNDGVEKQLEKFMVLDTFSINEMQRLYHLGEELEAFRLVMQLNRQTLRDIIEHYEDLAKRDNFPAELKASCKPALASFTRRVERIRKNLEIRVTQVESLIAWLQEGKALFDGILQYRSVQVSHMFTESSHIQSEKMEKIAYKTEKETISMHVITCVTLAFLPGTFVAAFFQSGLIEINQAASGVQGAVTFHPGAFKLFACICFPLMFLTFVLWVFLFKYLARRAKRREQRGTV